MQARLGHPVRVEARVGAREKLRVAGWQRARVKQQDRRWCQWRTTAGGGVARVREEKKQGGFYRFGGMPRRLLVASWPTGVRGGRGGGGDVRWSQWPMEHGGSPAGEYA
jgi:hypothetical protein